MNFWDLRLREVHEGEKPDIEYYFSSWRKEATQIRNKGEKAKRVTWLNIYHQFMKEKNRILNMLHQFMKEAIQMMKEAIQMWSLWQNFEMILLRIAGFMFQKWYKNIKIWKH